MNEKTEQQQIRLKIGCRENGGLFLYIKNFNASVGKGGYLPQSDRDDEDTLKTAAVFNRAEK